MATIGRAGAGKKKATKSSSKATRKSKASRKTATKRTTAPKKPRAPKKRKKPKPLTREQVRHQLKLSAVSTAARRDQSCEELLALGDKAYEADSHVGSEALFTWGKVDDGNLYSGLKSARRTGGLAAARFRRSRGLTLPPPPEPMDVDEDGDALAEANKRKPYQFLDLPAEIRRLIFHFLLVRPRPVRVYTDWTCVYSRRFDTASHAILRVNKLLWAEGSKYLYQQNVFQAHIAENFITYPARRGIQERYIEYYQQLVIDVPKGKYRPDEMMITANTVKKLVMNSPGTVRLKYLAIVMRPRYHARLTTTLTGTYAATTTHADWFSDKSELFKQLIRLCCKTLYIVVELPRQLVIAATGSYRLERQDAYLATADGVMSGLPENPSRQKVVLRVDTGRLSCSIDYEMLARRPELTERTFANAKQAKEDVKAVKGWIEAVVQDWRAMAHEREDTALMGRGENYDDLEELFKARAKAKVSSNGVAVGSAMEID